MKPRSRILLIAVPLIIALFGAVAYQYGYLGVQSELKAKEDAIEVKTKTLQKYMALVAEKPALEANLAKLTELRKSENAKIIEGQTPSVAVATLQSTVDAVITSRGGSVLSERVEKLEEYGKMKVITVSIDAVMPDTRALSDVLYAIETQTPYLVIRSLDARIRNFKEPRDLNVSLRVSGLTGRI